MPTLDSVVVLDSFWFSKNRHGNNEATFRERGWSGENDFSCKINLRISC